MVKQWNNIQACGSSANINISPQVPIMLIKGIKNVMKLQVNSLESIITFTTQQCTTAISAHFITGYEKQQSAARGQIIVNCKTFGNHWTNCSSSFGKQAAEIL